MTQSTLTYGQYCNNKTIRASLGWMGGFYIYNGMPYSKSQIDEMFPVELPLIDAMDRTTGKGANPDKSKNYINDQKSY